MRERRAPARAPKGRAASAIDKRGASPRPRATVAPSSQALPTRPAKAARGLAILRAAQRALVRSTDEAGLLALICEIAITEAGYRMAWAGIAVEDEERTIRPIAWAGEGSDYLAAVPMTWSDSPSGEGPAGTAIRDNRPALGRNFSTDPNLAPWRA
ncbi:MAG: GAF domain-containing protein, partial [Candidatus Limnocylindrales bacterium]